MRVEFVELAKQELDDAVVYYDGEVEGLGQRFRDEVQAAVELISAQPLAWPEERAGVQKYVLPRFPYNVLFVREADLLLILAIAHQRQAPSYWIDRL